MFVHIYVFVFLVLTPTISPFLNRQELIISGLALICEVQKGEFEHMSHFKVVSLGSANTGRA